MRTTPGSLLS
uniref:Uncharacterized protein n=1 Tax=Arundo donax TaxID=35708 RepID=A0A0A9AWC6_ARUDO